MPAACLHGGERVTILPMRRALASGSLGISALAWLCVLILYTWHLGQLIWPLDLTAVASATTAIVIALCAVACNRRHRYAWLALAVSLIFPIWLWVQVQNLPSDAF
jgi:hypothetical protein